MSNFGIKGLAITPVVVGRISIGHMEDKGGKRLPMKDDEFTVTTNIQRKKEWVKHPLNDKLRADAYHKENPDSPTPSPIELLNTKLRSIPVKMLFNDPSLNLRAEHTCFEQKTGRPICRGNGSEARQLDPATGEVKTVACRPDTCKVAEQYRCKPYTRFGVQIEGQEDELALFMFRTTGWNSHRALVAKLHQLHALANGKLAGMPLQLTIHGKSSAQSMGSAFFHVDLKVRDGYTVAKAVKEAREFQQEWEDLDINREAFEEQTRQGLLNGMFEDTPEETQSLLEEFYSMHLIDEGEQAPEGPQAPSETENLLRNALDQENQSLGIDVPVVAHAEPTPETDERELDLFAEHSVE